MQKRKIFLLIASIWLLGCDNRFEQEDLHGLWELKELNVDALDKSFEPTLLHIKPNLTYSVARTGGDFSGLYRLQNRTLHFESGRHPWFRTGWTIEYYPTHINFHGTEVPYTVTTMRWEKIDEVPDYRSFEEKVLGTWDLYKMRKQEEIESLSGTTFTITEEGWYTIAEGQQVLDEGPAIINTRHHKVVFVKDSIQWDVWFYGRELRLENKPMNIQYSLRRPGATD